MVNENSKTELKRLCTMNPLEMAERLHKAEQDVKVAKGQYEGALVIIKQLERKIDDLMLEYCPDEITPPNSAV